MQTLSTSGLSKILLTATTLLISSSLLAETREYQQQFDVVDGGTLTLNTDAGSLTITTHAQPSVEVYMKGKGDAMDDFAVTHETNGNDVIIRGKMDSKRRWVSNLRIKYEIVVPEHYNLDLRTAGGSINIADLTGNIDAHTSGGSIDVGNITGKVDLHTSGGSISTEAIAGPLDAHTSGGSINVTYTKQLSEDAQLRTSGGSITAYLPEDIALDLDASTSGGRVSTDFNVDGRIKKKRIKGSINGGGPTLKLHTSGGSVSVRSR